MALKLAGLRFKTSRSTLRKRTGPGPGPKGNSGASRSVKIDPTRFVFVDETGVTTEMTRQYDRAMKGERVNQPERESQEILLLRSMDQPYYSLDEILRFEISIVAAEGSCPEGD